METKTIDQLQLHKEGYTGIQGAQNQLYKVLREMRCNIPLRYRIFVSEHESLIVFSGNGIRATLHIEKENQREGGIL